MYALDVVMGPGAKHRDPKICLRINAKKCIVFAVFKCNLQTLSLSFAPSHRFCEGFLTFFNVLRSRSFVNNGRFKSFEEVNAKIGFFYNLVNFGADFLGVSP